MKNQIFYSETELNGKFQVMANFEIKLQGVKKYGSNYIITHKNQIYKSLNSYWVSKSLLKTIMEQFNPERACF